ncbi:glyoxalase [Micromonospora rosaria]|uniref:Glyoxalase n=1 Tax=Micromonospora rosaria TaxID=47874 RepID=A0A136PY85_9ACTN|nr:glyoxalase superfamily protein [Micromonospora rosaria]KXK63402.1 glyoxalase [Micromonospora rosaria]
MTERLAPVLWTTDANAAADWFARLSFVKQWEHRFAPDLPLYVSIARGDVEIHLSEHTGDARPGTLLYLYVDDLDAAAAACGVGAVEQKNWGREFEVVDLDGNRLRIGALHR